MNKTLKNRIIENDKIFLLIILISSILFKLFYVLPFNGPMILGDEMIYKQNVFALVSGAYANTHYPPLYSIFLIPATWFENYYTVFKTINIIITSLIIYPVFYISRLLINKNTALFIASLSLLLPYHFIFNKLVMSENLFYPLVLFTIYTFLKLLEIESKKWAIITGVLLALCILARYFGIVLIPILGTVYIIRILQGKKNKIETKKRIQLMLYTIAIILFISAIYYIPNLEYFSERSNHYNNRNESSRILKLSGWFIIYLFNTFILVIPFLPQIIGNIISIFRNKNIQKTYFFYTILSMTFFYVLLAAYHSSAKAFDQAYLLGRYTIYLGMPWIIFAFLNKEKKVNTKDKLIYSLISIVLISLTALFFSGKLFNTSRFLLMSHVSPSGYLFVKNILFVSFSMLVIYGVYVFYNKKIILWSLFIAFHCYFIFAAKNVLKDNILIHGNELKKISDVLDGTTIYNGTNTFDYQYEGFMTFWNKENFHVKEFNSDFSNCNEKGCLVIPKQLAKYKHIHVYEYRKKKFYIYKTPLHKKDNLIHSGSIRSNSIDLIQLFDRAELVNKEKRTDNPLGSNITLTDKGDCIFTLHNCGFRYKLSDTIVDNKKLEVKIGFSPDAKNWNVSDGMQFNIHLETTENSNLIMSHIINPNDQDTTYIINFPDNLPDEFILFFSTDMLENGDGDWGLWRKITIK